MEGVIEKEREGSGLDCYLFLLNLIISGFEVRMPIEAVLHCQHSVGFIFLFL